MASPTGIIPESLMFPGKLREVIHLLERLAIGGDLKEQLLLGYARTVGIKVSPGQRRRVRRSGIDYTGPVPEKG